MYKNVYMPSLAPVSSSAASLSSLPSLASHTQRQREAEVEEKGGAGRHKGLEAVGLPLGGGG